MSNFYEVGFMHNTEELFELRC